MMDPQPTRIPEVSGPADGSAPGQDSGSLPEATPPGMPGPSAELIQDSAKRNSETPLQWLDLLYLVGLYLIGEFVLGLAISFAASFYLGTTTGEVLQGLKGPNTWLAVIIQISLSLVTLIFLFVLVRSRTSEPFWPSVGWREFRSLTSWGATASRYALLGCALALIMSVASSAVDNGKTLPIEDFFHNRETVVLLILYGVLVAPVFEETVFRGCLYPLVAGKFGMAAGVVVTGTLFGLAHAPQLSGGYAQIALLVCVGIVLTYIRARAGTVFASYFVHVAYNSCLFAALIFSTGGLRHLPAP
jgi:membrane protease YdiL (CAAX protease family)